jgi:hypothetical protein
MGTFAEDYRDTIMWDLDGAVTQLNRTQISPDRMAFLVDEREWNELIKYTRSLSRVASEDDMIEMPIKSTRYRGIEVRKR